MESSSQWNFGPPKMGSDRRMNVISLAKIANIFWITPCG
jgi:hypothetical protein|tara:strand:- start:118 stop:234 length:117 start_codon:yes stop_codon:yes gene_type:complete